MSSSLVFVVIVGLWVVFLVPHWLRRREQLSGSRHRDRFSGDLRLLAPRAQRRRTETASPPARVLAPPRQGHGSAPAAARAAATGRAPSRAVAAPPRRRRLHRLSRVLIAATVTALPLVLLAAAALAVAGLAPVWAPAVPLGMLAVTVAGLRVRVRRRSAVRRRRATRGSAAAAARGVAAGTAAPGTGAAARPAGHLPGVAAGVEPHPAANPGPVGPPARPVPAALPAPADRSAACVAQDADPRAWTPVPVPPPTYTLKPSLPRGADAAPSRAATDRPQARRQQPPGGLLGDLDAVLQRRRAAGE